MNKKTIFTSKYLRLLFSFMVLLILIFVVKGKPGSPSAQELNYSQWKYEGPFELSPERGRYALTYSLIENQSFSFSTPIAQFASPDLGYINNKYVSLFAPGVSFLIMPGFVLGKFFNAAQYGSFIIIALFAFLNFLLIKKISTNLGTSSSSATLAGLLFLFGTNAFAYAVSLYQHHITAFVLLLSIYLMTKKRVAFLRLSMVWFLCAFSISIDYPNLFLMFPVGLYSLSKIFKVNPVKSQLIFTIKPLYIFSLFLSALPLLFFLWTNYSSYGNPLQLAGTVEQVKEVSDTGELIRFDEDGQSTSVSVEEDTRENAERSSVAFFNTRNMLNGFYVLVFSPDRGLLVYAPVIVLALFGMQRLLDKNEKIGVLIITVSLINLILYMMWGDPYGGWAFGPRYLVPAFAVLAVPLAFFIDEAKKNFLYLAIIGVIVTYSVGVNTLGALTSNLNPPEIEARALSNKTGNQELYTFMRNFEFLQNEGSKSYMFDVYISSHLSAEQYFYLIFSLILVMVYLQLMVEREVSK